MGGGEGIGQATDDGYGHWILWEVSDSSLHSFNL